jgi:hypothetical protein
MSGSDDGVSEQTPRVSKPINKGAPKIPENLSFCYQRLLETQR